MTNRERVIQTLLCRATDRPPLVHWLGFCPWGETQARWVRESGLADLDIGRYFELEPFGHVAPLEYGPYPGFEQRVIREDADFVYSLDWRGIVRRDRRDGGSMPEWISHPVTTPAEWERYKAERLQPNLDARTARIDVWLKEIAPVDALLQVGVFPWGVFGTTRDLLGAEGILLAFYDEPDMVRDIMETHVSLWLALFERVAQRAQIDHIHIWEDMSGRNGSLISRTMLESFMMPQYDRIAAFARQHHVPLISVDSDGDLSLLVPVMMRHGINVFFPFEVQAGCDIERYREQYPALGLLGGLDKNALAADKPAMHRELDRAERMLARGGYIAGFDHLIPPNVPWANYLYFMRNLQRLMGR